MKYTTEYIQSLMDEDNYTLLSEYVKALDPINVKCPKGHIYQTKWNNYQQGSRCPICYEIKSGRSPNFTYETNVKKVIEKEGYEILKCDYINRYSDIHILCNKGHQFITTYKNWKSGFRCPHCAGVVRVPFEKIVDMFEKEGYQVLTKKENYRGIWQTKIDYICINGHKGSMLGSNFRKGHRCQQCTQIPYAKIRKSFENVNYTLLTKEKNFVNANKTKLDYMCDKGHQHSMMWNNFREGRRCPKCAGTIVTYEEVKELIESVEGYKLLSKEYVNNKTKLLVQCNKGHQYEVTRSNFREGRRCPVCNGFSTKKLTYEFVKEQIESEGYVALFDKYVNNSFKFDVQCPKGHKFQTCYAYWKNGKRCPTCFNKSSIGEKEVLNIVKMLTNEQVFENDRTQIINPSTGYYLELDMWIPSLKKAIEYNGTYWHSSIIQKERDYEKEKRCYEKGIDLLIVEEEDWRRDKETCKDRIKQFINGNIERCDCNPFYVSKLSEEKEICI